MLIADPLNRSYDQLAVRGEKPVTLQCHALDPGAVVWLIERYWKKGLDYLYDRGKLIGGCEGRCTIDDVSYDLTIHRPEINDTGEYLCIGKEGLGRKHITHLYVTGMLIAVI